MCVCVCYQPHIDPEVEDGVPPGLLVIEEEEHVAVEVHAQAIVGLVDAVNVAVPLLPEVPQHTLGGLGVVVQHVAVRHRAVAHEGGSAAPFAGGLLCVLVCVFWVCVSVCVLGVCVLGVCVCVFLCFGVVWVCVFWVSVCVFLCFGCV